MKTVHAKHTITFIPPVGDDGTSKPKHGWLNINGEIHCITNIHHFDDFGQSLDTFTLEDGQEVYSHDEGLSFFTQDGSY